MKFVVVWKKFCCVSIFFFKLGQLEKLSVHLKKHLRVLKSTLTLKNLLKSSLLESFTCFTDRISPPEDSHQPRILPGTTWKVLGTRQTQTNPGNLLRTYLVPTRSHGYSLVGSRVTCQPTRTTYLDPAGDVT